MRKIIGHTIEIIIALLLFSAIEAKGQNVGNLYVIVDSASAWDMKDSTVTIGMSTYRFGAPIKTKNGLWVTPSINTAYFNSYFPDGGSWVKLPSSVDSLPPLPPFVPFIKP